MEGQVNLCVQLWTEVWLLQVNDFTEHPGQRWGPPALNCCRVDEDSEDTQQDLRNCIRWHRCLTPSALRVTTLKPLSHREGDKLMEPIP